MRTITDTLLTAQSSNSRVPFIKAVFTSYDDSNEVDMSKDSSVYGNRIMLVDHHEEPYNDYAIIILKNHDLLVPDLKGYWVEIGYGDTTATGKEYCGDGVNGGSESTPRLWVKHQQTVSAGGKLIAILELEGMWAKLRETLLRMGTAPFYEATTADGDFSAAKTPYGLIDYLLTSEIDPVMSLDALVEDDSIINTLEPSFEVNVNRPFQYAAEVIYDLVKMTKSYLKPKSGLAWEVKYPQAGDTAVIAYYSKTTPKFYQFTERNSVVIPNRVYVFANAGSDELYNDIVTGQADNTDSQDKYGIVSMVVLAPNLTTKADADNRAEAILYRTIAESVAGKLVIPHDCQLEMYDRVTIYDSRGAS